MITVTLEFETIEQAATALGNLTRPIKVVEGDGLVINKAASGAIALAPAKPKAAPAKAAKPEPVEDEEEDEEEEDEEEEDEEEEDEEEEAAPASGNLKKIAAQLKDTMKLRDVIGFLMEKKLVKDVKAARKLAADLKELVPCLSRIDTNTFEERVTNAYKFMESQAN